LRARAPGTRSLSLAQRIIIGFVKALDFAAVEALIPDLKPSTEGFGRSQVLNSVADGLSRCSEATIFFAPVAKSLRQKQFGGCVVVKSAKWGLPVQKNQDFEAAPVFSQSPINTAVGDMSAAVFVNL